MVTLLMSANPRHPGMAEARRPRGARALLPCSAALVLLAAGCGGSPPPAGPDGGSPGDDGGPPPSDGGVPDAIDPNRPDAGPPAGFDYPTLVTASDGASFNWFGYSVAADDNVIVVGAPFYDELAGDVVEEPSIGAAYVYERIGGVWEEATRVHSMPLFTSGMFGWSVAVDGSILAVGAWNEDVAGNQIGAVYVYERVGGSWTFNAKLTALPNDDQERFGHSVAVSGSRIAVGAPLISDVDDNVEATPAYVFERSGSSWVGTRLLPADDPRDSWFGYTIALSGNVVVVGAPGEKSKGDGTGAAYVFEHDGTSWNQTAKLGDTGGTAQDFFGRDVAVDGDVIVVGAEAGGNPTSLNTGIAVVFERAGTAWNETAKLLPKEASVGDQVGYSVEVRGTRIMVGAHKDDNFGTDSGAAYLFEKEGASWVERSTFYNPSSTSGDHFGASAAMAGESVVVGARFDDDDGSDSGSIYVFEPTQ